MNLVWGQGENTSNIVSIRAFFLFGKVPHNVVAISEECQGSSCSKVSGHPLPVHLAENVENERLNVEVEGLVVKEQLGQEAQVLAIQLVVLPIHLRNPVSESTLQFSISHC